MNEENNTPQEDQSKYIESINNAALHLPHIFEQLKEQTELLRSIKGGVNFFVVMTIIVIVLQACSILTS